MKQLDADFFTHRDKRDTFDVKSSFLKLLYTIQNQKGLIIFISFSVLCVTVLYMQIWPPVFKAEVILRFEADNDPQRSDFYQQWNVFRRDSLTDEALLITSPPVLIKVIKRLELSYEDVYHPFASYVTHLWGQSSIGKSYRKFKNMILGNPNSIQALTQNERERMKVLKDFKASVSLSPISESNIGLLVVRGPSAYVATIANTVVDVYLEMRRTRFVQEAEEAYNALASEASRAYDELHNVETRMTNYFEKNGLIMAYEKDRTALQQWLQLQQSIIDLESIVASHRESLAVVEQQLTQEQRSITSARLYQKNTLENQLTQLLLQHRDALEHFQANSPEIQFINNQISSVRKLMKDQGSVIQESSTEVINSTFETLRTRRAQIESDLEGALAALNVKHAAEQTMRKNLETLPQKMYIENSLER
ncbi:MAG: Wzz/FepE/Etk N-terminal domain-containing protein, partial [Gammaproteobacteria bacterium]